MCGRYTLTDLQALADRYELSLEKDELRPRYNAAPSQLMPVILFPPSHEFSLMEWGFLPRWAKDSSRPMINARSETVREKPSFRKAFEQRRCLVPADGFYEWEKTSSGKQPMRFVRKDRDIFSLAGIWEVWEDPESGEERARYAVLTTRPNALTAPIHDRMPAILNREVERDWLDPETDLDWCESVLKPYDDKVMEVYPVSKHLNSARIDDPKLIEAITIGDDPADPQMNLF